MGGGQGSGDGQLKWPSGVAIDSSGNVYVTDSNNRIQKFTSDGAFITKWGSQGSGNGEFTWPFGIVIDSSDNVYVADSENHCIQKFTSDGTFITKWGSVGEGDGQFRSPKGLSIDSSDNVYVADQYSDRIQKFTSDGTYITKWGRLGSNDGQINFPYGLSIDRSDVVYVADYGNNRIQKFTSDGAFIAKWGSNGSDEGLFDYPYDIAIDSSSDVYVTDYNDSEDEYTNHYVQKFTSNGVFKTKWGSKGSGDGQFDTPSGLSIDSSGNVYVADNGNNRIQKFTSDGTFITKWGSKGSVNGQFDSPTYIAIDSSNNVYVTDTNNARVQKFTSDGVFIAKWGSKGSGDGQFDTPSGLSIDSSGNVYVADNGNNRIQKFTSDGTFITKWGSVGEADGQFRRPLAVAIDSSGNIYVTDTNNSRIQKFTSEGTFITKWGSKGSAPGLFSGLTGIAVDTSGIVYVADTGNDRVQIFNSSSGFHYLPKAIIVAGGGNYQGNNLWDATQLCSNYAYRALTFQGYTKETIYYLTSDSDIDLDGNSILDDVDGDATNLNLKTAITSWATDASDLIVYITDHGGDKSFRMGETELLSALELNTWLDQLQLSTDIKVTIIYDACQSGSFLSDLSNTSYNRIFISSTSQDQSAYFTSFGQLSFSYYFWGNIFNGMSLYDAFVFSKNAIENSFPSQTPLLNADGNNTGNEDNDITLIQDLYIGNGVVSADDIPVVGSISGETTLNGETQASIFADSVIDANGISRVWAVITPPDYGTTDPSDPILTLPSIELTKTSGDRYEGTYTEFSSKGTYKIAVFARDGNGALSLPKSTSFIQTFGDSTDPSPSTINVKIKNLNVSDTIEVNQPVTFALETESEDSDTLYHRFSLHPDYGTSGYDGTKWTSMTDSEWVSTNSIDHTFTEAGKYIIVAWISDITDNVSSNGIPIIGLSVDVSGDPCRTDVAGTYTFGDLKVNSPVAFKVNAQNSCNESLHYRWSVHPDYGTSGYDGTKWTSMTITEWVSSNLIDYTFDEPGKYIVVVWVTDDSENVDSSDVPIIGWSVDIE